MQYSQEHLKTMVYAEFGGQTDCIMGNSKIENLKYLGVLLDPYLSWNDHIDYIGRKISATLGMLRKVRKVIPRGNRV